MKFFWDALVSQADRSWSWVVNRFGILYLVRMSLLVHSVGFKRRGISNTNTRRRNAKSILKHWWSWVSSLSLISATYLTDIHLSIAESSGFPIGTLNYLPCLNGWELNGFLWIDISQDGLNSFLYWFYYPWWHLFLKLSGDLLLIVFVFRLGKSSKISGFVRQVHAHISYMYAPEFCFDVKGFWYHVLSNVSK